MQSNGGEILVGADVSGRGMSNGSPTPRRPLRHWIARARPTLVGMEPTGGYERALCSALAEAGVRYVKLHPNTILVFRKAQGLRAKTDRIDAMLIARYLADAVRRADLPFAFRADERQRALAARRRQLVDARQAERCRADKALSVRRQCALLGVARSGVYRARKPANDNDAALMRRIDELFTAWPFLGSRRMTAMLRAEGVNVNRKHVQRLMRLMGIAALGPKPRTTKPAPGHKIYPYLLRDVTIERANHVWAADITYIPIGRGFLYLVAIIDWASRAVLAWRLSNTVDGSVTATVARRGS